MSSPALDFAVFVGGECMARFVHAPDAAHYRQQLIHRIRGEAPDLDPVQVAAGVAVVDSPHSPIRRQADGLPVHVWLVWAGRSLISVHASRSGAEAARRKQTRVRRVGGADTDTSVIVSKACVLDDA